MMGLRIEREEPAGGKARKKARKQVSKDNLPQTTSTVLREEKFDG